MSLPTIAFGGQGMQAPAIGFGTMGLTWAYAPPDAAALAEKKGPLFDACQRLGCNLLVTAWIYQTPGLPHNEEIVGEAIQKYGRDKWIIVDKIGADFAKQPPLAQSPAELREQLEQSLARLGTDYIDLLVLNRPDPRIPIEDTMAVFKQFLAEGKCRYVGLSEASPEEIRRAHAVLPLTAVEQEYSLSTRDVEEALVPVLKELNIGILAYSPLSRGVLSLGIKSRADLQPGDWRLQNPRFSEENIAKNVAKAAKLAEIAAQKGCTPAQLALAWLQHKGRAQGVAVLPIPGTTNVARLEENLGAAAVALTADDLALIEANVPEAEGDRYPGMHGTWNAKQQKH